jgi:hypothetical protein
MNLKNRVEFFVKNEDAARILTREIFEHSISVSLVSFVLGLLVATLLLR